MGNFGNNIFLWKLIWIIRRFSKAKGIWQPFVCWKIRRTAMFSFNKLFQSDTTSLAKITNVPVSYSLMVWIIGLVLPHSEPNWITRTGDMHTMQFYWLVLVLWVCVSLTKIRKLLATFWQEICEEWGCSSALGVWRDAVHEAALMLQSQPPQEINSCIRLLACKRNFLLVWLCWDFCLSYSIKQILLPTLLLCCDMILCASIYFSALEFPWCEYILCFE